MAPNCQLKSSQTLAALAGCILAIGSAFANAEVAAVVDSTFSMTITQFRDVGSGTIVSQPSGLVISAETILDNDPAESGAGIVTASGQPILPADPDDVGNGDDVGIELSGTATAMAPLRSQADVVSIGDLTIRFDASQLASDVAITFTANYEHTVNVSTTDPTTQSGLAQSFMEVFFGNTITDSVILASWVDSDSSFGGGVSLASDTISFEVVIPSGSTDSVLVGLIDQGAFVTVVPEPAGASTPAMLLVGMIAMRRRNRLVAAS